MSETEDLENMSTYEKVLKDLRAGINGKATNYVPQLANALLEEDPNQSASDIVDKIKMDCGYWSKDTIRKCLPEEIKDKAKQEAGKKGAAKTNTAKKKKAMEMLNDGSIAKSPNVPDFSPAENSSVSQKESNSASQQKNVYQSEGVQEPDQGYIGKDTDDSKINYYDAEKEDLKSELKKVQDELAEALAMIQSQRKAIEHPHPQIQPQTGMLKVHKNDPMFSKITIGVNKIGKGELVGFIIDYSGEKIIGMRGIK